MYMWVCFTDVRVELEDEVNGFQSMFWWTAAYYVAHDATAGPCAEAKDGQMRCLNEVTFDSCQKATVRTQTARPLMRTTIGVIEHRLPRDVLWY